MGTINVNLIADNGGSSNVMIGACAGQNQTGGSSNVFVGKYSGRQNTGKYNSAFGRNALQGNSTTKLTGNGNTGNTRFLNVYRWLSFWFSESLT